MQGYISSDSLPINPVGPRGPTNVLPEAIDPQQYVDRFMDQHPEFDTLEEAAFALKRKYLQEIGESAGYTEATMPDVTTMEGALALEKIAGQWTPAWDDEARRQSSIALYDQEFDAANPGPSMDDSGMTAFGTAGTGGAPRRHNGNELLPPETVYLMDLENQFRAAEKLMMAQEGVTPLTWSDVSIMDKMSSDDWENEQRFTRDGSMNHFDGQASVHEQSGEMPQTVLGNHAGANYFRFQEHPAMESILMSGRGPMNGMWSKLAQGADDLTGHSTLAMMQSGHDVLKIPELIAQKNAVLAHGDGQYELPTANQPSGNIIDAGIQGKTEGAENSQVMYNQGQLISNPFMRMLEDAGVPNATDYNTPGFAAGYEGFNEFFGDVTVPLTGLAGIRSLRAAKNAFHPPKVNPTIMKHVIAPQAGDAGVDAAINGPMVGMAAMGEGDLRLGADGEIVPGQVEKMEGKALLDRENFAKNNPQQPSIDTIREVVRERNPVMQKMQTENKWLQRDVSEEAARREASRKLAAEESKQRAIETQNLFPAFAPKPY